MAVFIPAGEDMVMTVMAIKAGIQKGANTHHQDHVMVPISFNTMNIMSKHSKVCLIGVVIAFIINSELAISVLPL